MEPTPSNKPYNFIINASNQANLVSNSNLTATQLNSFLIFIHPYELEKLNLEGLDIDVNIDENGIIRINDMCFEPIDVGNGIKVLGLIKTVLEE